MQRLVPDVVGAADPVWAGASGASLLAEVLRRVSGAGFTIGNVAVQVIGNVPGTQSITTQKTQRSSDTPTP